jgi:hypothetical protein
MTKKINFALAVLLSFGVFAGEAEATTKPVADKRAESPAPAAVEVAIIARVFKTVEYRQPKGQWKKADRGDHLASGDNVKTGADASSVIRFLDGSIVRVQANSELTVIGEKSGDKQDKTVQLDVGRLGFDVRKQSDEQFRFSSPTSVASIKGTEGIFSDGMLVILTTKAKDEAAEFKNVATGEVIKVYAGYIVTIGKDGKMNYQKLTPAEIKAFSLLLPSNTDTGSTGPKKKLNLQFNTSNGRKEIEIDSK